MRWFRKRSKALFPEIYPDCQSLFVFSNGWFEGLRRRYGIAWRRRVTKIAQKVPNEFIINSNNFIKFIRRVSLAADITPRNTKLDTIL